MALRGNGWANMYSVNSAAPNRGFRLDGGLPQWFRKIVRAPEESSVCILTDESSQESGQNK